VLLMVEGCDVKRHVLLIDGDFRSAEVLLYWASGCPVSGVVLLRHFVGPCEQFRYNTQIDADSNQLGRSVR